MYVTVDELKAILDGVERTIGDLATIGDDANERCGRAIGAIEYYRQTYGLSEDMWPAKS
jgi:hypothetical protein